MPRHTAPTRVGLMIAAVICMGAVTAAQPLTVMQKNRQFDQANVRVVAGDTVNFTNEDEFLHQIYVSSSGFNFDSNEQAPGDVVTVKFPVPGEFDVLCGIHPRMRLHVSVGKSAATKR
ncbi:cupredoxin domain-containing protein [Pigmentiphaga litoralis]|uniref:cupredoxin domain-containing protein n=1 Tax=Pigmentiphaga litoralis TaxID=516702 RepID=UPI003B4361F7